MSDAKRSALTLVLLIVGMMLLMWWMTPEEESGRPDGLVSESGWTVEQVIDGDTIIVSRGGVEETVRFIGIDAPERDACGYDEARDFLVEIVLGEEVSLLAGATTDRDVHGRMLRYVEYGGLDVGLGSIAEGFSEARYDSRTNQPHPREELYQEADAGTPSIC